MKGYFSSFRNDELLYTLTHSRPSKIFLRQIAQTGLFFRVKFKKKLVNRVLCKHRNPLNVKMINLSLNYFFVVVTFLFVQMSERA